MSQLVIARGSESPIVLRLRDRLGQPVVPAGKTIYFTAKLADGYQTAPDSAAIIAASTTNGRMVFVGEIDGYGVYHVLPRASDTADLPQTTKLVYDVEIVYDGDPTPETVNLADGEDYVQYVGHAIVVADVRRGA